MSAPSEQRFVGNQGNPLALQQQSQSAESLALGLNAWRWAAFDATRPFCHPWAVLPSFLPPLEAVLPQQAEQQEPAAPAGNLTALLTDDQPGGAPSASGAHATLPQNGWGLPSGPPAADPGANAVPSAPPPPPVPQQQASFALVVGGNGEVSHTASGLLADPGRYPHFAAAREYLLGALRLDAAALALRARLEDPAVAAALDCKPDLLLGALSPHHLSVAAPQLAVQMAAGGRGGAGPSGLAGATSAAGKALAFSKLVRKASRGVFKRVIRRMLQRPEGALPLCTSNRCIIASPGMEGTPPPLLDMRLPNELLTSPDAPSATSEGDSSAVVMDPLRGQVSTEPSSAGNVLLAAPAQHLQQVPADGRQLCAAGGTCAPTRAALSWPDDLPCVDPSKVSVPVEKAIGLMEWVQSLGHIVPELQELNSLKKRSSVDTDTKRNVKPKAAQAAGQKAGGGASGDAADDDAVAGLAALRAAPATVEDE